MTSSTLMRPGGEGVTTRALQTIQLPFSKNKSTQLMGIWCLSWTNKILKTMIVFMKKLIIDTCSDNQINALVD